MRIGKGEEDGPKSAAAQKAHRRAQVRRAQMLVGRCRSQFYILIVMIENIDNVNRTMSNILKKM